MKLVKDSDRETAAPLIDKMLFLESQLERLEKLPMIKVNPLNPQQQKTTPAAKQYKEFLQQYTNILKIVLRLVGSENTEEDSPLRAWAGARLQADTHANFDLTGTDKPATNSVENEGTDKDD